LATTAGICISASGNLRVWFKCKTAEILSHNMYEWKRRIEM
jgi:hypothetical protein